MNDLVLVVIVVVVVVAAVANSNVRPIIPPKDATDESNREKTTRIPNDRIVVVVVVVAVSVSVAVEVTICYTNTHHSCGRRRKTANPEKTTRTLLLRRAFPAHYS